MKKVIWKGFNDKSINCYIFDEVAKPKAVVVIVHGMQEHALRYKTFAKKLNEEGFLVFASDLRGHGKNVMDNNWGYDDNDIFLNIVEDQKIFINNLKKMYKLPVYVLGHSYGSFVTQRLILECQNVDKFVLSGSAYTNTMLFKSAKIIAKISSLIKGKKAEAKLIEKMSIKGYGKNFEDGNWLSRDKKVWAAYQKDEMCGNPFPNWFYVSMFTNLPKNYKKLKKANKNVKLFLIAGDNDPVGANGESVKKLCDVYIKNGFDATLKLYKGARHEVLNETNKQEVVEDLIKFFK